MNSDPAPAIALREALAARRAAGEDFEAAWPGALDTVLGDVASHHREAWRETFTATEALWRAGYQRDAVGTALFVA